MEEEGEGVDSGRVGEIGRVSDRGWGWGWG